MSQLNRGKTCAVALLFGYCDRDEMTSWVGICATSTQLPGWLICSGLGAKDQEEHPSHDSAQVANTSKP